METLNNEQCEDFLYEQGFDIEELEDNWAFKLRHEQFEPEGAWDTWYVNTGRGWGKTLTGSFWVNDAVMLKQAGRIALIAPTAADTRDVMVEGPTGIMATAHKNCRPEYFPSLRKVMWENGAEAHLYSAEEPERLRGPQHDRGWCDEMAAWKALEDTWDMYQFGLRVGLDPKTLITTTPKPRKLLKEIKAEDTTVVTTGSTYENVALSEKFKKRILKKYEGTRLGRQELEAEDLDQAEGALWNREMLEELRVETYPLLKRLVVGIDPATTKTEHSDEVGIIIGGLGFDNKGYILQDLSRKLSPGETCRIAVDAYTLWEADRIVAEVNNGGDWIELGLRQVNKNVSYKKLHASRGKQARAEPVVSLYEQMRIHHVGNFPALEDELCGWEPGTGQPSPNHLDALVWVITELMLDASERKLLHVRA